MAIFGEMFHHIDVVRSMLGADARADADARDLPRIVAGLGDADAVTLIRESTAIIRSLEAIRVAATGVVAQRSTTASGHTGLAQSRGHASPIALVQELTGTSRADAAAQVRVGGALFDHGGGGSPEDASGGEASSEAGGAGVVEVSASANRAWHAPADDALLSGIITTAQHDAIVRGLGTPPAPVGGDAGAGSSSDDDPAVISRDPFDDASAARAAREAWTLAAHDLVAEAGSRTVEELGRAARAIRDMLDEPGATRRFDERFERRSFRIYTDRDGVRRASILFDDEGGAWVQSIITSALRPRRGGPRFVDADENRAADDLLEDPRTNDQLTYDLMIDTLRAGALADAAQVFGARQPGIRIVVSADALHREHGTGHLEDENESLPAWLIRQHHCDTGGDEFAIDDAGNPLFLGRRSRLFSSAQKIALALRDGGCRWSGCDRPASYCEAHHIDRFATEDGRTDVDRGILLCRFHHMNLHHGGWRITRAGLGDFVLHPPGSGEGKTLPPRLQLAYAWAGIDPPPRRFRPTVREPQPEHARVVA